MTLSLHPSPNNLRSPASIIFWASPMPKWCDKSAIRNIVMADEHLLCLTLSARHKKLWTRAPTTLRFGARGQAGVWATLAILRGFRKIIKILSRKIAELFCKFFFFTSFPRKHRRRPAPRPAPADAARRHGRFEPHFVFRSSLKTRPGLREKGALDLLLLQTFWSNWTSGSPGNLVF